MKKIVFSYVILLALPLLTFFAVFMVVDSLDIAVTISLVVACIDMVVLAVVFKRVPAILFSNFIVLMISGIVSLLLKDIRLYLVAPALYESLIVITAIPLVISSGLLNRIAVRFLKIGTLPKNSNTLIRRNIMILLPVALLHSAAIVFTAWFNEPLLWVIASAGILLLVFVIWIIVTAIYRNLYRAWLKYKYRDDEWFDIVDEKGHKIGMAPRTICHNGSMILHPVVHVHIYNSKRDLLLQKRSESKIIQPGMWDTSVGGHIQSGEQLLDAVIRETTEEAGINIDVGRLLPLKQYVFESDVEREMVFSFVYFDNGPFDIQPEEIDEVRFFSFKDLIKVVEQKHATPNFEMEFSLLQQSEYNFFEKKSEKK